MYLLSTWNSTLLALARRKVHDSEYEKGMDLLQQHTCWKIEMGQRKNFDFEMEVLISKWKCFDLKWKILKSVWKNLELFRKFGI